MWFDQVHQSREWVDGSWVMGQMGHENGMGHMGHGSLGDDPWPISFLTLWLGLYIVAMIIYKFPLLSDIARRIYCIPASSAECERHFSAFNARHIITAQRNNMQLLRHLQLF